LIRKLGKTDTNSSKSKFAIIITSLVIIGLVLVNFIIQIGVEPGYTNMGTDSGTFAYCGEVIHNGGLMYRDCWDNKPPGVYYLNAVAIVLGGSNPFAIWLFQAIWLSIAVVAFFLILKRVWRRWWLSALGAFTLLAFVLYPDIFQGGNFTETYAILTVVLSLGAFWACLGAGQRHWLVALGVLAAGGFLLKQTYIAIPLAGALVITYLELRRRTFKTLFINLAILFFSAFIPLFVVGMFWVWKQDFNELWFAIFSHNFTYIREGFSLLSLYSSLRMFLIQQPMAALTILVAISAGVFLFQHGRVIFSIKKPTANDMDRFIPGHMDLQQKRVWFMAGVFLGVIFDFIFFTSSGKNFGHYLQVLLPGMIVVMVYLVDTLRQSIQAEKFSHTAQAALLSAILVVGLMAGLEIIAKEIPSLQMLKSFISTTNPFVYQPNELEQYIIDNSTAQDSVLIWAGHPGMNFVTKRRSPTRYIFLLHLFTPTPYGPNGFDELLKELKVDPPELIVAQPVSSSHLPFFGDPNDPLCRDCDPLVRQGLADLNQYVTSNYALKYSIWDWEVYQRVP
jgi:hypothetical protein